jgi:hypothetical protein
MGLTMTSLLVLATGAAEIDASQISGEAHKCFHGDKLVATWFRVNEKGSKPEKYLFKFENFPDSPVNATWVVLDKVNSGRKGGFDLRYTGEEKKLRGNWLVSRQPWGYWTNIELYPTNEKVHCGRHERETQNESQGYLRQYQRQKK